MKNRTIEGFESKLLDNVHTPEHLEILRIVSKNDEPTVRNIYRQSSLASKSSVYTRVGTLVKWGYLEVAYETGSPFKPTKVYGLTAKAKKLCIVFP